MKEPTQEAMQKLWEACQGFITEKQVYCAESIYQTDRVLIAAPELVEAAAEIVGYLQDEEEDEE